MVSLHSNGNLTKINGNPTGRTTVSTNLIYWEFTKPKTPIKEHSLVLCPQHICSKRLPCLTSFGDDTSNYLEIFSTGMGDPGWHLLKGEGDAG